MRLLHTVGSIDSDHSGVAVCVKNLARSQARLGEKPNIYTMTEPNSIEDQGVVTRRFSPGFFNNNLILNLGWSRALRKSITAEQFHVVHTHGLWLGLNSYQSKSTKFVISPHGMLSSVALEFSKFKKAAALAFYQRGALNSAHLLMASAMSEYNDIRSFGLRQPVAIIPHGIDVGPVKKINTKNDELVVISLGRIHPKKGLINLVNAWAQLTDRYPNWILKIVGPDEDNHTQELKGLVRNLNLKRVEILPAVYGTEKVALMEAASLFVLPSFSENFALTVAESLALGVPVIATNGTPWEGLELENCGWWIDVGIKPLVQALDTAMALPETSRHELGQRGRNWMLRDFTWLNAASQSIEVYNWLIHGGEVPPSIHLD
ncbi:glycosyltransferase [Sphingorhabdus sp. EL138]|uniref:glycosyltransferase n=1 Tax=Sphingorhabdus sp. EL138 TaxID=2073156 RepID=UPI0025EF4B14|nr:glycosyltransferase [Sphingorhabdus sp. EL138]